MACRHCRHATTGYCQAGCCIPRKHAVIKINCVMSCTYYTYTTERQGFRVSGHWPPLDQTDEFSHRAGANARRAKTDHNSLDLTSPVYADPKLVCPITVRGVRNTHNKTASTTSHHHKHICVALMTTYNGGKRRNAVRIKYYIAGEGPDCAKSRFSSRSKSDSREACRSAPRAPRRDQPTESPHQIVD